MNDFQFIHVFIFYLSLMDLEQHEAEERMTEFSFLGEKLIKCP